MRTERSIFDAIDTGNPLKFAELFAADATIAFGNGSPLRGREAIAAGADTFLSTIRGLSHRVLNEWHVGSTTITEAEVTYTRLDNKVVTVPAVSIWQTRGDGLLVDYRVFFDLTPLYAP
jgi:ketosteroid isomerase-like protein